MEPFAFDFEFKFLVRDSQWNMHATLDYGEVLAKWGARTIACKISQFDGQFSNNWQMDVRFIAQLTFNTVIKGKPRVFDLKFDTKALIPFKGDPRQTEHPVTGLITLTFHF